MNGKPILAGASLAFLVCLSTSTARAVDLGGQFGFGAGLAVGPTHQELSQEESGGGGLGLDVAARLWLGPLVVGANAMGMSVLVGPSETLATASAGLKLDLGGDWRLMPLLEAGRHKVYGLGNDLFSSSREGGTVALPCWGGRLVLEKRIQQQGRPALGVSLFALADRGQVETDVRVSGFLNTRTEKHRVGGYLMGALFRVMVGS